MSAVLNVYRWSRDSIVIPSDECSTSFWRIELCRTTGGMLYVDGSCTVKVVPRLNFREALARVAATSL